MTGQPPNKRSQSPERGRRFRSRGRSATNGRLAGAAAMLTHGVAADRRTTIGIPAYTPAIRRILPIRTSEDRKPCYSPAVKISVIRVLTNALQRTAPIRAERQEIREFPPFLNLAGLAPFAPRR